MKMMRSRRDAPRSLVHQKAGWWSPDPAPVGNFRKLDGEEVYMGTIRVFTSPLHLYAIRVTEDKDGIQIPALDPHDRLEDAYRLAGEDAGPFVTTEIHGLEGEYVLVACAFVD